MRNISLASFSITNVISGAQKIFMRTTLYELGWC